MKVTPDWRNQYTTLDSARAKNKVRSTCEMCGVALNKKKRFCGPCSDQRLTDRRVQREARLAAREFRDPKIDTKKPPKTRLCVDCGQVIKIVGKKIRCSSCSFQKRVERVRIHARRNSGHSFRLTDLEIPKAFALWKEGLRTDQIAEKLGIAEAAIANSLSALKEQARGDAR